MVVGTSLPDIESSIGTFVESVPGSTTYRHHGSPWIGVRRAGATARVQGWKLHVSASIRNASEVLTAVLAVVRDFPCDFKVAADLSVLFSLNDGSMGWSQVGKFVTVYPNSDDEALKIAEALARQTRSLGGPSVPSDRRLRGDSPVYYRFGSFTGTSRRNELGETEDVLVAPDGTFELERRGPLHTMPSWAEDPFEASGLRETPEPTLLTVNDRYVVAKTLSAHSAVTVFLTVDTLTGKRTVLKRVPLESGLDKAPADVVIATEREAQLMEALAHTGIFPKVVDTFTTESHCFLAMEHLDGVSFDTWIQEQFAAHDACDLTELRAILIRVAAQMEQIHGCGYVYADLKSHHVFIADDTIRLIDAESLLHDDEVGTSSMRTPGYASPRQLDLERANRSDDVHTFGALVYEALTDTEPWAAPHRGRLLDRAIESMRPQAPTDLVALAKACLSPDPGERPKDFGEIQRTLANSLEPSVPPPTVRLAVSQLDVVEIGLSIAHLATKDATGRQFWPDPTGDGPELADLGTGSAGIMYVLAEIADAFRTDVFDDTISSAARWLVETATTGANRLGGLYIGECGIGVALLQAGRTLDRRDLVEAGLSRVRESAELPFRSPDLFTGAAGRLRAHLAAWNETEAVQDLEQARAAAAWLIDELGSTKRSVEWPYPDDSAHMAGKAFYGYAHGIAGIADALLDLAIVDDSPVAHRAAKVVRQCTDRLRSLAMPGPTSGGTHWESFDGDGEPEVYWCHGATGITRFLLRVHEAGVPDLGELINSACCAIAARTQISAGQCHGLAGSIEVLLDASHTLSEERWEREAARLGDLVVAFLSADDDAARFGERPPEAQDLLQGRAGVLRALARLQNPSLIGTLISPVAVKPVF